MDSKQKTQTICKLLSDRKASKIVYIDVSDKTSLCDFFIIAGGRSATQVKSLAENVDEILDKQFGVQSYRREGLAEGKWAVLDYGDVIVHVFNDEERDFYHLERLWEDGKNLTEYQD